MPVILPTPADPIDLVLQGEHMRQSVFDTTIYGNAVQSVSTMAGEGFSSEVRDEDGYPPMNDFIEGNRLGVRRSKNGNTQVRANAGIATPLGAWIPNDWPPLLNPCYFATVRWFLTGVTRDSAGSALGNCRVVALETGRLAKDGAPIVGETISDGSGNYSIEVATNVAHQVIAYLPGAPDVAGISLNTLTPTAG
jgi:hypothetical protein